MKNAFKLFDFYGTPVYLKYWFLILFLFLSIKMVTAIFISILIHELAHAYTAMRLGYKTESVFIDILHGGAQVDESFQKSNKDTIKIVGAGPLSNLIMVPILSLLGILFSGNTVFLDFITSMIVVNIVLFLFNMLPIYPLDGGRISKAIFQIFYGENGKKYNGILSILTSSALLVYSILNFSFLLMFFSIIFLIFSYNEIKPIDNK